jgi:metal-responsive CopG/Arc/MetJ family transcriptional regulator
MTAARKVKISVSLDPGVLAAVDRLAARERTTRSAVMEHWLRRASHQADLLRLEDETAAYYESLSTQEKDDDESWATTATNAARKLDVDGRKPTAPRKQRQRPSQG